MFGLVNVKFMEAFKAKDYLQPANEGVKEMRFVSVSSENNPRTSLKRSKRYRHNLNVVTGRINGSL